MHLHFETFSWQSLNRPFLQIADQQRRAQADNKINGGAGEQNHFDPSTVTLADSRRGAEESAEYIN